MTKNRKKSKRAMRMVELTKIEQKATNFMFTFIVLGIIFTGLLYLINQESIAYLLSYKLSNNQISYINVFVKICILAVAAILGYTAVSTLSKYSFFNNPTESEQTKNHEKKHKHFMVGLSVISLVAIMSMVFAVLKIINVNSFFTTTLQTIITTIIASTIYDIIRRTVISPTEK